MNVGRGFFRAWILVSVLWILGAGAIAYSIVAPDTIQGSFQPSGRLKEGVPWETDYTKPFYDVMRSPAAEKLAVVFFPVERRYRTEWEKASDMHVVLMPDGSRVYMNDGYNEADRAYIATQFWDQRWRRWGHAAAIIALWAFVPCVLLFILGYSLLWVARGFTRA